MDRTRIPHEYLKDAPTCYSVCHLVNSATIVPALKLDLVIVNQCTDIRHYYTSFTIMAKSGAERNLFCQDPSPSSNI